MGVKTKTQHPPADALDRAQQAVDWGEGPQGGRVLTYLTICASPRARSARTWGGRVDAKGPPLPRPARGLLHHDGLALGERRLGRGRTFFREVDAIGFGDGEFEMTTNSDANSLCTTASCTSSRRSRARSSRSRVSSTARSTTSPAAPTTSRTRRGTTAGYGAAGIDSTQDT
ncbi:hypothetical protein K438DRAFT_237974 [Mycena galopus ATCC 62051]|nr:hypothetical protein K438DRAFT_237974 [Mycena galopus ATCC 62051]